ncbi:MAG: methylenetetrahydrofolate reductase [Peptococcaceae bacterium]|jgi:5,10-methylenetetrahydrofolate reductase|nr:methylenetetrahydrofolate reductase [Peptococcaceae bacterium]MDH7524836.1 methylenetetrahydrofolate reductase [Peptococcaceae bacterium]
MTITELAGKKSFLVTAELTPPKGTDYGKVLEAAENLVQAVDAVNVTDGQSAVMRSGSLALSHFLLDKGIEPVFQLNCRDRNRIALQSELLSAFSLGIKNVLCITGDHVGLGDHKDAKQVFDLDAVSLLAVVSRLNEGCDMKGNPLAGATNLCPGAVVNPNASPVEPQLLKMKRKIQAGARFFQTQPVFEISLLKPFADEAARMGVPLLAGVMVLRSAGMARYINKHISGISVPVKLVEYLEKSRDPVITGLEIAAGLINEARGVCRGVHLMTIGAEELVPQVLEKAGIKKEKRFSETEVE